MRITLQIVQSHAKEQIPCIILSIENQKYFFNIPDSFQRYFKEHSVRFPKGGKIFLTQLSSDHITGLFGLILTLNAQGLADNSQIFGPPGFCKYIDSIRFLIGHRVLPFSLYDFYNNHEKLVGIKSNDFVQEVFNRKDYDAIFFKMNDFLLQQQKLKPELINDAQDFIKQDTFYKDENLEIHPILACGENPTHKLSLCYILKPNKIPGKVNAEKLKANNIQPKYIKKLLEAEEVEIEGKIYKQKDFKDADSPSPLVVIIDCPSEYHLISLANDKRIQSLFADKIDQTEEVVKAIIHLTPSKVLTDPKYTEFLKCFSSDCEHIFLNDEIKPLHTEFKIEKPKKKGEQQVAEKPQYRHFLLNNLFAKYFPCSQLRDF
jgi:ribonuclease Z